MTKHINGKAFAKKLCVDVAIAVAHIKKIYGIAPGLAVILVGDNPASTVYVASKGKRTLEVGMESFTFRIKEQIAQSELLSKIDTLNRDAKINGILVQLPLPRHIEEKQVIDAVAAAKDVDGFNVRNAGQLFTATGKPLIPCTPYGCLLLLQNRFGKDLSGLRAVVVGRSNIVGKPMAQLLLDANATVTIVHSKTKDIEKITAQADIVVAAIGRPEHITSSWIKPGATVIDVGINRIEKQGRNVLVGDVDHKDVEERVAAITPVPGGVGPMTIAVLLYNTVVAACRQQGWPVPQILEKYHRQT